MRISDWSSDVCSSDLHPHSPSRHCPYPASDQFLARIILAAKAVQQFAVEPRHMTSRMGEFVQRGAVIIDLIEKGGLRAARFRLSASGVSARPKTPMSVFARAPAWCRFTPRLCMRGRDWSEGSIRD